MLWNDIDTELQVTEWCYIELAELGLSYSCGQWCYAQEHWLCVVVFNCSCRLEVMVIGDDVVCEDEVKWVCNRYAVVY